MKPHRAITLLIVGCMLGVDCGQPVQEQEAESEDPAHLLLEEASGPTPFDSLPMPDFPEPRPGHLVARGVGAHVIDGAWEATARMCEDPPILQILARQPQVGTLILLQLPLEGERLTEYPITVVEWGMPPPPASQIGVQLLRTDDATSMQAVEGEVSLDEFGDRISGRFTALLREIATEDREKYAGVFTAVPIERMPTTECLQVKEAMEQADSTASDSTASG